MRQPIVKDLRSKTKAKAKAKAKDFIKCPRGQGHDLEDFITDCIVGFECLQR